MAARRKKPPPSYDQFRKAHHRHYMGQLNDADKLWYRKRYKGLFNDHAAADWRALETTRPAIAAAYRSLSPTKIDRDQPPPTAGNRFALPTFIHVEDDQESEIEEPEGGTYDKESEDENGSEDTDGEGSQATGEELDSEKADEDDAITASDVATSASDSDDLQDTGEESEMSEEEQLPYTFEDRGEPNNGLCDDALLPLTITGKEGSRINPKEFEALDFDEYPSNEWIDTTKDAKTAKVLERTRWTWYPKMRLGQGARGRATIWVEVDDDGIVGSSIVAKDVDLEKEWDSRSAWWDDNHEIPMEVAAHRTVCSHEPSPKGTLPVFILPYQGFRVHKALRSFRLLMEHAPHGDLFDLMQKFPLPYPREKDNNEPEKQQEMIPVTFAWRVFLALIQAAIHIHAHGIIHRDLKPENILLMDNAFVRVGAEGEEEVLPEAEEMEGWNLKPVIGDFGSARPVERQGFNNPDDFDTKGHAPYFAPEELRTEPAMFTAAKKIDEKTTVFHLGCCLHQFLHGGKLPRVDTKEPDKLPKPPEPFWRHQDPNPSIDEEYKLQTDRIFDGAFGDTFDRPELDWAAYHRHFQYDAGGNGHSFITVMTACLQFDPDGRPDLETLLEWVMESLHGFPEPPSKEDHDLIHSKKRKRQPGEQVGDRYDHKETIRLAKLRKTERGKGV